MTEAQRDTVPLHQRALRQGEHAPREHLPARPLWLCRACGQPWPCGQAKLDLLAEYQGSRVSLCLYLATSLCNAIDDLHRLNSSMTGSTADLFDRFLGWLRACRPSAPAEHAGSAEAKETGQ
ncbi:hypothetical protein [Plantactinospora sp. WMMB782]|uniref:hypothetical protein n=1 Tax=Plantactinospora sp. WMMB782 TaxID=3404121 RepID=UPI003B947E7F